jgi:uncharacterized membrane protein YdbT with pleckstrin-like domain
MPPQDSTQPPVDKPVESHMHNPLAVLQPGEQTLFDLKRHPIGIIIIYVVTVLLLAVVAVIGLVVAPALIANGAVRFRDFATVGLLVLAVLAVIYNLIATVIYWGNRWVLTTDSLTEMTQTGLFHKTISQLDIGSLEDVTADKNGILPHLFNYGKLRVETAGHLTNFIFFFTPNPDHYAQVILEACEQVRTQNQPSPPPP